ncbi:NodT family efflux transporter outer membrane factor (OMF) lipoprotein [Variovorax boronicumulans]|uniref:NodT family efflux transporter outer membrane factor (OMF) lipoprotein n=2 Tax=Variovorax boronicumulans TaxID=436515 RepID=A0AAW8DRC0_9BURK|nr:NodT family efflux transporter outer membrane factor (OMF) lipoprotein [Variovorax boronicumulans]MDP9922011.1 NodT family efflux transporter outer membrane factor (OMF) lipoprotein [Variovorax boronicumulans]
MTRFAFRMASLAVAAGLAACAAVGPDYRQPPEALASQPAAGKPFAEAPANAAPLPAHWWRLYHDPLLDRLVTQALAHNTDLRQAVANLERERAIETEVAGAKYPTIGVNGGPSFGHVSGLSLLQKGYEPPNTFNYSAGASLSYQVDLFGQIRRAIEASAANSQAAEAALDLVRVNVAAGTARAYAEACSAGQRLQIAQKSVALQQDAVNVTERLQRAGRAGAIDAGRARAQLAQLDAALPPLKAQRQGALYRLATLTGALPQDFPREVADCTTPPRVAGALPVGDGAALLRRRPDIRQAERSLAASTARIGVATADLYPKVTLGLSGSSAGHATGFGRQDTLAWSVGPLISWTVPNTGAAQARIAQAEAGTRAALAKFDGTVLTALRETETALGTYARELDRRAALQASRDESAKVAAQARQLYRNGRTAYLDALDAERALAGADAALAASEAQLADDQVVLFMALGGGWEPADDAVAQGDQGKPATTVR